VHRSLERQLELGEYYGRNIAALRDRLLTDVPPPVRIVWLGSRIRPSRLGENTFDKIVGVGPSVSTCANEGWAPDQFGSDIPASADEEESGVS